MPKFNPPEPMSFDAPAKWPEWKERFARFRIATKLHKDEGEIQVASLIYAMGRQAENIFKSFTFDPPPDPTDANPNPLDPKDNYDVVLKKYDTYFVPKRNTIYERAKFYQRLASQLSASYVTCMSSQRTVASKNARPRIYEID